MAYDREKNTGSEVKLDPNAWMATFADLLMLLLTFFVMLLTMKSMDQGKIREIFVRTYGPLDFISQNDYEPSLDELDQYIKASVITSSEAIEKAIDLLEGIDSLPGRQPSVANLRDLIDVFENEQGVVIALESDHLFDSGDAEIHPDRLAALDAVARLFKFAANDILIMGHTDSAPIRDERFESNWELSVYRALSPGGYDVYTISIPSICEPGFLSTTQSDRSVFVLTAYPCGFSRMIRLLSGP